MAPAEIVRATWRDARALVALDHRSFQARDWYGWLTYVGLCLRSGIVALKASSAGTLVGFVAGAPHRRQGFGVIVTLAVDPVWRRQGLGERLMQECEMRLDFSRIRLQVRRGNSAAIQLYRKRGYVIIGDLPVYYGDEDGFLMEKVKGA